MWLGENRQRQTEHLGRMTNLRNLQKILQYQQDDKMQNTLKQMEGMSEIGTDASHILEINKNSEMMPQYEVELSLVLSIMPCKMYGGAEV
jgi:hypothetical protein